MKGRVSQIFYVDENQLEDLGVKFSNEYYIASLQFYRSVKNKNVEDLSEKQIQWLQKIVQIQEKQALNLKNEKEQKSLNYKLKKFTLFPKKGKNGWVWLYYFE